ncbi:MAG: hypothetical protein HY644_09405 [Acidobacteria bacterium]|nr:hypothetical protein [Acidobacteriota bacterium]
MQRAVQLLNKINLLGVQQRRDIGTLLEALQQPTGRASRLVTILARQLHDEYLQRWVEITGGQRKELKKFLRGTVNHVSMRKASLVNLYSGSEFLVFSALFHEDAGMDNFVQPDLMEIFYVVQGSIELTLHRRRGYLHFCLSPNQVSQVRPGASYQLFASSGTHLAVVHAHIQERVHRDFGVCGAPTSSRRDRARNP